MQPVHEPFRLALRARPTTPLQHRPDYDLLQNGTVGGEVYYNMTGYVGTLPQLDGTSLTLGETGISAYRAEVARINREARNLREAQVELDIANLRIQKATMLLKLKGNDAL